MRRYLKVVCFVLQCVLGFWTSAQGFKDNAEKAEYYMDRSLKVFENKSRIAINFETVAFGLKQPLDVFSKAVYQQHKGGYIYMDGGKYEYNVGMVKILCDAKLMIYVDEINKQIMIDSVRGKDLSEEEHEAAFKEMFQKKNGDFVYQYQKIDTIGGKTYHKVKCTLSQNAGVYMYYWISVKTEQMYMYAEYNEGLYNVYLLDKISSPPHQHKYTIYVPNKELTTFHGYEVIDQRFTLKYDQKSLEKLKELRK